jgi:hypothetical protein
VGEPGGEALPGRPAPVVARDDRDGLAHVSRPEGTGAGMLRRSAMGRLWAPAIARGEEATLTKGNFEVARDPSTGRPALATRLVTAQVSCGSSVS